MILSRCIWTVFSGFQGLKGNESGVDDCIRQLEGLSKIFNVDFVLSVSMDKEELSADLQSKTILAL